MYGTIAYVWACFSHSPFTNPQMQSKNFCRSLVESQCNKHKTHRSGTENRLVVVPYLYFWSHFGSFMLSDICGSAPVTWLQICSTTTTYDSRYVNCQIFTCCLSYVYIIIFRGQLRRCTIFCVCKQVSLYFCLGLQSFSVGYPNFLQDNICHLIY